jgi:hypothetical protein
MGVLKNTKLNLLKFVFIAAIAFSAVGLNSEARAGQYNLICKQVGGGKTVVCKKLVKSSARRNARKIVKVGDGNNNNPASYDQPKYD